MQPTHLADELVAGAQIKMIGIREQDPDAELFGEVALREAFDRGLRAYRHEDRGLDGAVRRVEQTSPRTGEGALGDRLEGDGSQVRL